MIVTISHRNALNNNFQRYFKTQTLTENKETLTAMTINKNLQYTLSLPPLT